MTHDGEIFCPRNLMKTFNLHSDTGTMIWWSNRFSNTSHFPDMAGGPGIHNEFREKETREQKRNEKSVTWTTWDMSLKLRPCQTDTPAAPEMRILNYEELLEAATSFLAVYGGRGAEKYFYSRLVKIFYYATTTHSSSRNVRLSWTCRADKRWWAVNGGRVYQTHFCLKLYFSRHKGWF